MFDDDWKKNNTDKNNPTVCNAQINNTKPKIFRRNRLDSRKQGRQQYLLEKTFIS